MWRSLSITKYNTSAYTLLVFVLLVTVVMVYWYRHPSNTISVEMKEQSTVSASKGDNEHDVLKGAVYVERMKTFDSDSNSFQEHGKQQQTASDELNYPLRLYGGFDNSNMSLQVIRNGEGVANVVAFVWCGKNRLFEFKHMLSVLAALKIQKSLRVVIYHWPERQPVEDLYNTWLTELKDTFYNFEVTLMPDNISKPGSCTDIFEKAKYLSLLFSSHDHGLIYIDENIVLRRPVNEFRSAKTNFVRSNGFPGVLIGQNVTMEELVHPVNPKSCLNHKNIRSDTICVSMDFDKCYPKDIMRSDEEFSIFARQLFYGSARKKIPRFDLSDPIPNIGHFYLIGENTINFFVYLSIYSMISVLKVDVVYLHADMEPKGDYWEKLKRTQIVQHVYCPPVETVFGNRIDPSDKFHGKDILSVYFLYLYGGIFIDWDAIFTRRLQDDMRGYDVILGYDWFVPDEAPTFPEVINPGIIAAKRHSVFISMWLEKYKAFGKRGGFYYTGLLVPYKLYEHYPETVKLDPKFQVICWKGTCHPPWLDGYQKPQFHSEFDWTTVYSVHFTYPDPPEFYSWKALKKSTTMIGEMGQRVMGWR